MSPGLLGEAGPSGFRQGLGRWEGVGELNPLAGVLIREGQGNRDTETQMEGHVLTGTETRALQLQALQHQGRQVAPRSWQRSLDRRPPRASGRKQPCRPLALGPLASRLCENQSVLLRASRSWRSDLRLDSCPPRKSGLCVHQAPDLRWAGQAGDRPPMALGLRLSLVAWGPEVLAPSGLLLAAPVRASSEEEPGGSSASGPCSQSAVRPKPLWTGTPQMRSSACLFPLPKPSRPAPIPAVPLLSTRPQPSAPTSPSRARLLGSICSPG